MNRLRLYPLSLSFISLFVVWLATVWNRQPFPLDETRYLGVAFEMWRDHQYLLPTLNGVPYAHKPPLYFWLINLGWSIFGVGSAWPRFIPAFFVMLTSILVYRMGNLLWPGTSRGRNAVFILMGTTLWLAWSSIIRFDLILSFFVVASWVVLLEINRDLSKRRFYLLFAMLGLTMGAGLLTKGPIIYLFVLPVLLGSFYWRQNNSTSFSWRSGNALAISISFICIFAWAIPAALIGGENYAESLFWHQSINRMTQSFAHARPWYWYVPVCFYFFFPWTAWPPLWRGLARLRSFTWEHQQKFLCIALVPAFIGLSLISGKQDRYLYPLVPIVALFFAFIFDQVNIIQRGDRRFLSYLIMGLGIFLMTCHFSFVAEWTHKIALSGLPLWWGITLFLVGFIYRITETVDIEKEMMSLFFLSLILVLWNSFTLLHDKSLRLDTDVTAKKIAAIQQAGGTVCFQGDYQDQYQFLGKLTKNIKLISKNDRVKCDMMLTE